MTVSLTCWLRPSHRRWPTRLPMTAARRRTSHRRPLRRRRTLGSQVVPQPAKALAMRQVWRHRLSRPDHMCRMLSRHHARMARVSMCLAASASEPASRIRPFGRASCVTAPANAPVCQPERLIWLSLPWATFGLVARVGLITEAPPIARWTVGRSETEVAMYYRKRGAEICLAG
jgi:hypothetical protein